MGALMKCQLSSDQHGPPQPVSTYIGLMSPTGMYRLDVHGPVTGKALRNIIRQLELYASFFDESN